MAAIIGKAVPAQRQRVIDALHLREPDRVPVGLWGTTEGYQNLRGGLGMDYNEDPRNYRSGSTTWTTDVAFELDIAEKLDLDFVRISIGPPGGSPGFRDIRYEEVPFDMGIPKPEVDINVDEWGVVRKWTPHDKGGYYEMIGYPLFHATSAPLEEGLKMLDAFPWPDPWDESCWQDSPIPGMSLREYCRYVREETPFALMGQGGRGGLFEQAKYMVGYAKIFSDFIESPEFLEALLVKLTDIEIEFNKAFLDQCGEYLDWLRMSPEDLASEKTVFLSLKMFERRHRRAGDPALGHGRGGPRRGAYAHLGDGPRRRLSAEFLAPPGARRAGREHPRHDRGMPRIRRLSSAQGGAAGRRHRRGLRRMENQGPLTPTGQHHSGVATYASRYRHRKRI